MIKTCIEILIFTVSISAQSLIEQIGWKGADAGIIAGLIITLFCGLGFLLGFYLKSQAKLKADQKELDSNLFNHYCEKTEINDVEIARLLELLKNEMSIQPHIIFQSITLFERCIDTEVKRLSGSGLTQEQIDQEDSLLSSIRKKLGYSYLPLEHPLVSTRNLEIGLRLSVFGKDNQIPVIHKARVVHNSEFFFRIQYDSDSEEFSRFEQGQSLKLGFSRQNDGVYGIPVTVLRMEDLSSVDLCHSLDLRRNQLRQYVRVDVSLPLRFRLVKTENEENEALYLGKLLKTQMSDLSGGGLSFNYEKPMVPGDLISMSFQLSDSAFAGISGKVLRVSIKEGKTETFYRHHIQFINIEQRNRDKIIKYVFEKQRQASQWR
ncbi:MAG: PilZ domain-containing protein [Fibrobacter sp.]|nr:PilZ domain-containing protein [Fibrobacter sp.]